MLIFASDKLDAVFLMMIAKPLRDSKKTGSPTYRELTFPTTPFSQNFVVK